MVGQWKETAVVGCAVVRLPNRHALACVSFRFGSVHRHIQRQGIDICDGTPSRWQFQTAAATHPQNLQKVALRAAKEQMTLV